MEYRKYGDTIIVRMDPGEEIVEQVTEIAKKEKIKTAMVNALGATNSFTIGAYSIPDQRYYSKDYSGVWEIVSLHGNITGGENPVVHLHLGAGSDTGEMVGGHLNRAVISATCEMFITLYDANVEKTKNPANGLNIFKFND